MADDADLKEDDAPGGLLPPLLNLAAQREEARRELANRLVWILAGLVVIGALAVIGILVRGIQGVSRDELSAEADVVVRVLGLVFSPIVALVGGALGFYYATRDADVGRPP